MSFCSSSDVVLGETTSRETAKYMEYTTCPDKYERRLEFKKMAEERKTLFLLVVRA
jgi:hypothetical protein